jgi:hypothetical protein
VLGDLRNTNTFCTEAIDMGKETLTRANGMKEQLAGSCKGTHSASKITERNQVSGGSCVNHVICVLDLQAASHKLCSNIPGPRNTLCVSCPSVC